MVAGVVKREVNNREEGVQIQMYVQQAAVGSIYHTEGGSHLPGELDRWLCIPGINIQSLHSNNQI